MNWWTKKAMEKKIVICGSMSHYKKMLECQAFLREHDIDSLVPQEENDCIETLSEERFREFKRKVSIAYLRKIRGKNIFGILVVNEPKRGIENYIGANTFAEIAVAFTWYRHIFILHDLFTDYMDELVAWQATPLKGELAKIVNIYRQKGRLDREQLRLFDT